MITISLVFLLFFWYKFRVIKILILTLILTFPYLVILFKPVQFSTTLSNCLTSKDILKIKPITQSFLSENINSLIYKQPLFLNLILLSLGVIGIFFLIQKTKKRLFLVWIIVIFILLIKRYIYIPSSSDKIWYYLNLFWYWIDDERFLYHLWIPLLFLASFSIYKISKSRLQIFVLVFLVISPSLYLEIYRPYYLRYQYMTREDMEYINWIGKKISEDRIIYFGHGWGSTPSWVPVLAGRKTTTLFLIWDMGTAMFKRDEIMTKESEILCQIQDSKEALNILKKYNASYITFSTSPSFLEIKKTYLKDYCNPNPNKFTEPCYTKLYGRYDNWIFKVNYNCNPQNYLTLQTRNLRENVKFTPFYLSDIYLDPHIIPPSDIYVYVYYNATRIGNTYVNFTTLNHESVVKKISQFKVCRELLTVFELPSSFISGRLINISFTGEPIDIINISLVVRDTIKLKDFDHYLERLVQKMPQLKKISENIYLQGDWSYENDYYIAPKESLNTRIILKNTTTQSKLVIEYLDNRGSIDFNYYDGEWKPFGILYKQNSNKIKTKEFDLKTISLFSLNIFAHEEPFFVKKIYLK